MNIQKIVENKIRKVSKKKLLLHKPFFNNEEIKLLNKSINSSYVSTTGILTKRFEANLKKKISCKYVIATNSGTSALHAALLAFNFKKNDEILVPSLTFVASVNSICYIGCIPHFVDTEKNYPLIDIEKLENYLKKNTKIVSGKCLNIKTGKFIRGIIVVHMFGHCVQMNKINQLSKKYNLNVIEDAAEALGSKINNQQVGTFGKIGILSFNGNKIITTGGGGAILTNDKKIYKKCLKLINVGKSGKWKNEHDIIGYNYAMPSLNASIGISQLKKLNFLIKFKRKLFRKYEKVFQDLEFIKLLAEKKNYFSNYWLQTLLLGKENEHKRDHIIQYLKKKNIQVRPVWKLIHTLKPYKNFPKMDLKNSRKLEEKIINLPSGIDVN